MSDVLPPLPSRRALREMGLTGPIQVAVPQPQSRRERKILEATGAIPVITEESLEEHHPESAPVAVVSAPVEVVEPPVAPPAITPDAVVAPPAERPLTRRELREQLRSPAKDAPPTPVVESPAPITGDDVDDVLEAPAIPPKPVSREAEEEFSWQAPLEADDSDDVEEVVEEPSAIVEPVRPLPPTGRRPSDRTRRRCGRHAPSRWPRPPRSTDRRPGCRESCGRWRPCTHCSSPTRSSNSVALLGSSPRSRRN